MNHLENKIWVVVGTRPECIKQVPLFWSLQKKFGADQVCLIGTGQHQELLQQALAPFKTRLDYSVELPKDRKDLVELAGLLTLALGDLFRTQKPRAVVVQGDTTTSAISAICAFYQKIPLFHNEAGLRSFDLLQPFPEEANRKWITAVADLHFAPTELATQKLHDEQVDPAKVFVTGNTGIDALHWALKQLPEDPEYLRIQNWLNGRSPVLVTAHRRENEGSAMKNFYEMLAGFANQHSDLGFVCPIHPNNLAKPFAEKYLAPASNTLLVPPLDYVSTCHLLSQSALTMTDSGGIQEEGCSLGVPVVVCRAKSERMEAINAGLAKLCNPNDESQIQDGLRWAYQQFKNYPRKIQTIYGDGQASDKITALIEKYLLN